MLQAYYRNRPSVEVFIGLTFAPSSWELPFFRYQID